MATEQWYHAKPKHLNDLCKVSQLHSHSLQTMTLLWCSGEIRCSSAVQSSVLFIYPSFRRSISNKVSPITVVWEVLFGDWHIPLYILWVPAVNKLYCNKVFVLFLPQKIFVTSFWYSFVNCSSMVMSYSPRSLISIMKWTSICYPNQYSDIYYIYCFNTIWAMMKGYFKVSFWNTQPW